MEETHSLSRKTTKPEARQQTNNRRSSSIRSGGSNNIKQHSLAAGQVMFRLLCHAHTAGGVIGSSGSIIKHLETLTGSKIWFEEGIPNCMERVINIIGDAALDRKVSVDGSEEDGMVDLSKAQEGLMRVFERVLEVERNIGSNENEDGKEHNCNGYIRCRLLAPTGRIGALMGKGGEIVDGIQKSSRAKIRVLKKEQLPPCAGPAEELIQIMGEILAVKKALLAVSCHLQDRTLGEGAPVHMPAHGVSYKPRADFSPKNKRTLLPSSNADDEHHSVVHSLSADVERIIHVYEDSSLQKVQFRFLCSNGIAGGVIGKGANIVKYLEKDTGASIRFAPPMSGSTERVAIISSLENPDPLFSPAQIAVVSVFTRCIEVGLDQGVISSLDSGESMSARILVASSQVSCMMDENGSVASDISIASGAEIQLMGVDDHPNCAGVDDNVVQISGDYENVKSALFQLAGRLRENFFSGMGDRGARCWHSSSSAVPIINPNGREVANSTQLALLSRLSHIDPLDRLGFVQKSSSSHQPGLQWKQSQAKSLQRTVDCTKGQASFPSSMKCESNVSNEGSKQKVEVVVARELFASVYGENGSNLARLREISRASVKVKDPCPGESSGKVIICGTPERIQMAQSLLQAFISF